MIIGSKDINNISRYKDDKEMYETCPIILRMFDSWFWEVFSKDEDLINRLSAKYKDAELLTDFNAI